MREIRVLGTWTSDTRLLVIIDGVECKNVLIKDCIFSFTSPVSFHGYLPISIDVLEGQIKLTNIHARYPTNLGTVEFPIPMNPIARIHHTHIEQLTNIIINSGEKFKYDHLIVNGPTHWVVDIPGELYVADINNSKFTPIFNYTRHETSHTDNLAFTELEKLLIPQNHSFRPKM